MNAILASLPAFAIFVGWLIFEVRHDRAKQFRRYRCHLRKSLRRSAARRRRDSQAAYDAGVKFATEAIRVQILDKIPKASVLPALPVVEIATAPATAAALAAPWPPPHAAIAAVKKLATPDPRTLLFARMQFAIVSCGLAHMSGGVMVQVFKSTALGVLIGKRRVRWFSHC